MSTSKRKAADILEKLKEKRLVSVDTDNPKSDQRGFLKIFRIFGQSVRVSKDPDGTKLWFKRK